MVSIYYLRDQRDNSIRYVGVRQALRVVPTRELTR
jgi:hypothetical protein